MSEPLCPHCGSVLTLARILRTTEDGSASACEACAIAEGPRRLPRARDG